jgi:thymidylate synthase ThyX
MQRRGIPKTIQEYLYAKESHRAPEQARALLPQSMYTQFSMTGTLQRGMQCIAVRSAPEVQYETRLITSLRASSIARCFPSLKLPHPSGARGLQGILERCRGVVLTSLPLEALSDEHARRLPEAPSDVEVLLIRQLRLDLLMLHAAHQRAQERRDLQSDTLLNSAHRRFRTSRKTLEQPRKFVPSIRIQVAQN